VRAPVPGRTSVLIVAYRTRELLAACLRSIEASSGERVEVVVVDNASGDGTAELVAERFPAVELLTPGENLGFARGVNLAAEHATGDVLVLLNPDTVVHDGALERLAAFARAHPRAGLVGGRTLMPDGRLDPRSCWGPVTTWSLLCFATGLSTLAKGNRVLDPESLGGWRRDSVREVATVTGCLLAVRRVVWDELDGLDPDFFVYGEDVDLSLRAARLGYRPMITPDAVITHVVGASSSDPAEKQLLLFKGKATLARKHGSRAGLALLAAGVAARAAGARLSGSTSSAWPELWRRRREWLAGFPRAPLDAESIPGA
jgi:GT2 family glycosyltransferase